MKDAAYRRSAYRLLAAAVEMDSSQFDEERCGIKGAHEMVRELLLSGAMSEPETPYDHVRAAIEAQYAQGAQRTCACSVWSPTRLNRHLAGCPESASPFLRRPPFPGSRQCCGIEPPTCGPAYHSPTCDAASKLRIDGMVSFGPRCCPCCGGSGPPCSGDAAERCCVQRLKLRLDAWFRTGGAP